MKKIFSLLIIASLILVAAPALAAAPSADLMKLAPKSSKVLIGVNVPAVRQSFLFDDVLDFIRTQPANQDVLGFVLQSGIVDVEKDLDGMLIATPAPAAMPTQPGANVPKQDVALFVNGKLDKEKTMSAAKSRYGKLTKVKHDKLELWDAGSFVFGFADDRTLVLVSAEDAFSKATWASVVNPKVSVTKDKKMQAVVKRIKLSRGIWMATTQAPAAPGMAATPIKTMGLTIDIAGGLKVDMRGEATSAENAKQLKDQIVALKNQTAQSPMVATMGAGPLVANLSVSQSKERVDITTRMTNSEFKSFVDRLKAMRGGTGPMVQPPAAKPDPNADSPAPKSGANADFN